MESFVPVWRRATVAEVAWIDAAGEPAALTAVPLLEGPAPCVALTYDRAAAGPALAGARAVAFAVTDSRALPTGARAVVATGRVTVTDDLAGEDFSRELLDQELRKYPPARALADSPLLRRENWWFLPRVLVRLDRVDAVRPLAPRGDADREALLVRPADAAGAGIRIDVAAAADWSGEAVELRAPGGAGAADLGGSGEPVLAHGHDFTPDRERWKSWDVRGDLWRDRLAVTARTGTPGLDRAPMRLLERLRRARTLGRACRDGIAAAERAAGRG